MYADIQDFQKEQSQESDLTILKEKQIEQIEDSQQDQDCLSDYGESIDFYNKQWVILNQLDNEDKEIQEQLNCLSSVAMTNQLEDRKDIMKKYLLKMAQNIDAFESQLN